MSGSSNANTTAVVDLVASLRSRRNTFLSALASEVVPSSTVYRHIEDNSALHHLYIVKVVESLPGVGKVQARRALERLGIDELAPAITVDEGAWSQLLIGAGR